jgi:hypothetical protein
VLAGEVRAGGVFWCHPVESDAEARQVVSEASRLRADALAISRSGDDAASDALRNRARALEGRLVDPFWRSLARVEIVRTKAAWKCQPPARSSRRSHYHRPYLHAERTAC